jgi:hypothetical protein
MKPRNQIISIGTKGLRIETVNYMFKLNGSGLNMHAHSLDFRFTFSSSPTIFIKAGSAFLKISPDGLDIGVDDSKFHIDGDGVKFEAEGYNVTIDATGAHVESDNPGLDLSQYEIKPGKIDFSIPKIQLPPAPKLPKVKLELPGIPGGLPSGLPSGLKPSLTAPNLKLRSMSVQLPNIPGVNLPKIPGVGSLGKVAGLLAPKEPRGNIEDWLSGGETVKEQVDLIRRRKLFMKKTVHLVLTSTNRLFFCSALYGEKRGDDLVLGKNSKLTPVKAQVLEVIDSDEEKIVLTFKNTRERDDWKSKLQEVIDALP